MDQEFEPVESFADKAGQAVKVGDFIVYAAQYVDSPALKFGKVLGIKSFSYRGLTDWRIRAVGVDDWYLAGIGGPVAGKPGTLKFPQRIILANAFIPQAYKDLLDAAH